MQDSHPALKKYVIRWEKPLWGGGSSGEILRCLCFAKMVEIMVLLNWKPRDNIPITENTQQEWEQGQKQRQLTKGPVN